MNEVQQKLPQTHLPTAPKPGAIAVRLEKPLLIVLAALILALPWTALGGNPAEEMAKLGTGSATGSTTGGIDPHGDSWTSIQNSFQQFAHPEFVLRLFLSLSLAAACACTIGWRPRRFLRAAPRLDFEERKTLIILGVVGAIIAELSETSTTLAFVIFGVGALLRFRTVLDDPKATGKAILAVVLGLACGMGSWTMAVFVTVFSWVLLLILDSRVTCNMTIRIDSDPTPVQENVQTLLAARRCRIHSFKLSKNKKRMEFVFAMPAEMDRDELETDIKAQLPQDGESRVSIKVE